MRILKPFIAACLALSLIAISGDACARFVSVDPVPPDTQSGENFNRYYYANNNPYRFTDPDGRQIRELNAETARSGNQPPPRSPKDWMGPAIGHALTGMVSAPLIGFGAGAMAARPAVSSAFNAAVDIGMGDALGGASLTAAGATLFRVVDSVEFASINTLQQFTLKAGGMESKQFVGNAKDATALAATFTKAFGGPQHIVRAFAPQHVMDGSDVTRIGDAGGMDAITVPGALLPQLKCLGSADAC